jgi:hypothetical protein
MGFFSSVFGSSKPRVTENEFKKVRSDLAITGMDRKQRDRVESIFSGDMYRKATSSHPVGVERDELESRIKWMRDNKKLHGLNDTQIDNVERAMKRHL